MKTTGSSKVLGALALTIALATNLALAGTPDSNGNIPRVCPPHSEAYGKSLQEWLGVYWQWAYGTGSDMAQSVVDGVQLMPLPAGVQVGDGTGTPDDPTVMVGTLEITLRPGTPFVLPEYAWVGERYQGWPEVKDDPPMDNAIALTSGHPTLAIDGRLIMTDANKADFYVPLTYFNPAVPYPTPSNYGSVAAVYYQGVGLVSPPLTPGKHIIHLYEPLIIPAGAYSGLPAGLGLIYDNTWIITVKPK